MKIKYYISEINLNCKKDLSISGVYSIYHEDELVYVGSSKNIYSRWKSHIFTLSKGQHHNIILQRAWDKYKDTTFIFKLLEEVDEYSLLKREQYYIDTLNPRYNIKKKADILGQGPSKKWVICNPKKEWFIIDNLKQFCEDNKLQYRDMRDVAKGRRIKFHKSYFCREATTKEIQNGKPKKVRLGTNLPTLPYIQYKEKGNKPTWTIRHKNYIGKKTFYSLKEAELAYTNFFSAYADSNV